MTRRSARGSDPRFPVVPSRSCTLSSSASSRPLRWAAPLLLCCRRSFPVFFLLSLHLPSPVLLTRPCTTHSVLLVNDPMPGTAPGSEVQDGEEQVPARPHRSVSPGRERSTGAGHPGAVTGAAWSDRVPATAPSVLGTPECAWILRRTSCQRQCHLQRML